MAVNWTNIAATPATVFSVLADPTSYDDWVVGASRIRDVEGDWPGRGATFHHTQGVGPLGLRDTTTVLASEPPHLLVLEVRARPLVVAKVTLRLDSTGRGRTAVTMVEEVTGGVARRLPKRLVDPLIRLRNALSLRRLRRLTGKRSLAPTVTRAAKGAWRLRALVGRRSERSGPSQLPRR